MTDFNHYTFGFIGLGLIGGSIAKAIHQFYPSASILAYNPSPDTLQEALDDGVVTRGVSSLDAPADAPFDPALFETCDIVFLCAPVQKNAENLALLSGHLKKTAILSDIGSTKRDIHEHVRALGLTSHFVGGHPMTGSERTRYRNAKASLLENAYYILTPEENVPGTMAEIMTDLVTGLKALPLVIAPEFHDYAVAAISHVPHVVSASLVNLVKASDNPDAVMKTIAAGGFKDITRISSSSPVMWQQICLTNGDNIVKLLDAYIAILEEIKQDIRKQDPEALYDFFDHAKDYRDSFASTSSGATNRIYIFSVDIEDQPGMLAEVVTLLAVNAISIKNIGITHNREFQQGVLRIEVYSQKDLDQAEKVLTQRNFVIHV